MMLNDLKTITARGTGAMMGKWMWSALLLVAGLNGPLQDGVHAETAPGNMGKVIFYNISGGNEAVFNRAKDFASKRLQIDMVTGTSEVAQAKTVADQVKAYDVTLAKNEMFRVLFVDVSEDSAHAQYAPEKQLLVVNVAPLKTDDQEKFGRRVERQVMRGLYFYSDRKICPNPQCCLWDYQTIEHLDMIGRGACPPCMISGRESLQKKGFKSTAPTFPAAKATGGKVPAMPALPVPGQ